MVPESNERNSIKNKLPYIEEDFNNKDSYPKNEKFAAEEAQSYEKQRADQLGKQGIRLNDDLFSIARILVWILTTLFILLLISWFYHLVAPICWRWLSYMELQTIERILFASTILSFAGKYFAKFDILKSK